MAYPDRTYATAVLPGAASATRFLDTPVDGGYDGEDAPDKEKMLENFVSVEAVGVGEVQQSSD